MAITSTPIIICPQCYSLILNHKQCQNPGCSWQRPKNAVHPGTLVWKKPLYAPLGNHVINPGIKDNKLCIPTADDLVIILNTRDGSLIRAMNLEPYQQARTVIGTPYGFVFTTFDSRSLVPATQSATFWLLDSESDKDSWRFSANAHSLSAPAVGDRTAYCFTSNQQLLAFDLVNREKYWEIQINSKFTQWSQNAPLAFDSYLILPGGPGFGHDGHTIAYKAGKIAWEQELSTQYTPAADMNIIGLVTDLKSLHFLDLTTGVKLSKTEAPRAFSTAPVCSNGRLFIGVREQHETNAIYAYGLENRKRLWRYQTSAPVVVPPTPYKDRVYACDDTGMVYELMAATGELCWQYSVNDYPRSRPQVKDSSVILGTHSGMLYALATDGIYIENWDIAEPSFYREKEQWELSAVSYALRGQYGDAGDCYVRAGCFREAAVMFREDGNIEKALHFAEESRCLEIAVPILHQQGQFERLGSLYDNLGHFRQAAQLFEETKKWQEAALAWEKAHEYWKAAKNYLRVDCKDDAGRMALFITDLQKKIQVLEKAELYGAAAEQLESIGELKKAFQFYYRSAQREDALRVAEKLEDWKLIVPLALELAEYERAARVLLKDGQKAEAAQAFEKAGLQIENNLPDGEVSMRAAELYRAAQECMEQNADEATVHRLQIKIDKHCQFPKLRIECKAPDRILILEEYATLEIMLSNVGWGQARMISPYLEAEFVGQDTQVFHSLNPGEKRKLTIMIQPHNAKNNGPSVLIQLNVQYLDRARNKFHDKATIYVAIARDSTHAQQMRQTSGSISNTPGQQTVVYGPAYFAPVDQSHHQTDTIHLSTGKRVSVSSETKDNQPEHCTKCGFSLKNFPEEKLCPRCADIGLT